METVIFSKLEKAILAQLPHDASFDCRDIYDCVAEMAVLGRSRYLIIEPRNAFIINRSGVLILHNMTDWITHVAIVSHQKDIIHLSKAWYFYNKQVEAFETVADAEKWIESIEQLNSSS